MYRRMGHFAISMILLWLLNFRSASAKEFAVTITGEGLDGTITLTNPFVVDDLMNGFLEDHDAGPLAAAPDVEGEGYVISRGLDLATEGYPIDRVRYFPREDDVGYIYYEAWLDAQNSSGANDVGQWFYASLLGDLTLRRILDDPDRAVAMNDF